MDMLNTIKSVHRQEAVARAEADAKEQARLAARNRLIGDTLQEVDEINSLRFRLRAAPACGAAWGQSELTKFVKAHAVRFWLVWAGNHLLALLDHPQLLGTYNNRPATAHCNTEPGKSLTLGQVLHWMTQYGGANGTFAPCNGEGWTLAVAHADGIRLDEIVTGVRSGPTFDAADAMEQVASWAAKYIDPDSLEEPCRVPIPIPTPRSRKASSAKKR